MSAAKKMPGKPAAEMFDDIPVLQRKWRAALKPGERLPRYEDVMLGSLGRLADHIALLKSDGALELSRSGRYVQKWLGEERWDIPVAELSPDCATALSEAVASALENGRPHHAQRALRARRHGQDLRSAGAADRLALGRHAGRRLHQRARCAIQSAGRDLLLDRRRGRLAGDAARRRRQAVRSPDRAPQQERRRCC